MSKDTVDHILVKDLNFLCYLKFTNDYRKTSDFEFPFSDYHFPALAQKVKSYIKYTSHFLTKLKSLGKLPQGAILCTIAVVGLYSNITQREGLTGLPRFLELRDNKQISSDTLIALAAVALENNFFEFDDKTFKQVRGPAFGKKFAPPYAILFIGS